MKARHAFQMDGREGGAGDAVAEIKAAWQQHETAYGIQTSEAGKAEGGKEAGPLRAQPRPAAPAGPPDRAERRQQGRAASSEATDAAFMERTADPASNREIQATPAEAENSPVERGFSFRAVFPARERSARHAPPQAAESTPAPEPTADQQREAEIKSLLERWQAERDQSRDNSDPGREMD